jgi:hypothetical protein
MDSSTAERFPVGADASHGEEPGADRPAIVVGYGAFGRSVLRRLLAGAAARGVLRWEQPPGSVAAHERRLRDLALLAVDDPLDDPRKRDREDSHEGSGFDMMMDLYRQIRGVDGVRRPVEEGLSEAVGEAAEVLLSAATRSRRVRPLPLGLDVVVIVQPGAPEVVGQVDRLLHAMVRRLAAIRSLQRGVQSAEALSFIELLDFEDYWETSALGRSRRLAVRNSVDRWQERRARGEPACGRFYLFDGGTRDGLRTERTRIDEICLLLELLLFEGQRAGELQRLYQPGGAHELPLATAGVRVMERSAGLLTRLAAAWFGNAWLAYLGGADPHAGATEPARHFGARFAPYTPDQLDALLGAEALAHDVQRRFTQLEQQWLAAPIDDPDWPQRLGPAWAEFSEGLREEVSDRLQARVAELGRTRLQHLRRDLQEGIEADLHDSETPLPLGPVCRALETARRSLDPPAEDHAGPDSVASTLAGLARLHRRYRRFHRTRVDVAGLTQWWPLLALVLAAVLTPLVVDLLQDVPPPDRTRLWLVWLHDGFKRAANAFVVGPLLAAAAWAFGRLLLHPRLAARVERGRRFFRDARKGRFADALRAALRPGGGLRAAFDVQLERLACDARAGIRGQVARELDALGERLAERQREIEWLRKQLQEFLRVHGVSARAGGDGIERVAPETTGIRHLAGEGVDIERILATHPPKRERFRSLQAQGRPFVGWSQRYCGSFLNALAFIDELSHAFTDPFESELAQAGVGREQQARADEVLRFLERFGTAHLAFDWQAQEGLPPAQRLCVLPDVWRKLPGVLPRLADLGVREEQVLAGADGRAYLLRVQTGVDSACLLHEGE